MDSVQWIPYDTQYDHNHKTITILVTTTTSPCLAQLPSAVHSPLAAVSPSAVPGAMASVAQEVSPLFLSKLPIPDGKTLPPNGFFVNAPQTSQFAALPVKAPRPNAQNGSHVVFLHKDVQLSVEETVDG